MLRTLSNKRLRPVSLILAAGIVLVIVCLSFAQSKKSMATVDDRMTGAIAGSAAVPNGYNFERYGACQSTPVKLYQSAWPGYRNDDICLYHNDLFRYGITYSGSMYVSVGNDEKFYMVENMGTSSPYNFMATPETHDVIIGGSVAKDFLSGITFDETRARYTSNDGNTYNLVADETGATRSFSNKAIARNGQWIVLNIINVGLVRFHLTDMSATWLAPYDYYSVGLAITNDGKYIAAASYATSWRPIIYNVENCGINTSILQSSWYMAANPVTTCPSRSIGQDMQDNILNGTWFTVSETMYFDDNDSHLVLWANLPGDSKIVTVNAPGYVESPRLDYLALGDSISSGEGDITTTIVPKGGASCTDLNNVASESYECKYYRKYTDENENKSAGQPREKCHLSIRSYPYLLATSMQLGRNNNPKQWDSVACSGAKTTDVRSGKSNYSGQMKGGVGDDKKPRLEDYNDKDSLQATALNEMVPGRVEQIEFVKKHKPKVITLTAGANDIEFSAKLQSCLMPEWTLGVPHATTCDWATTLRESLAKQIQGQYDSLLNLYNELHSVSPQSKIYVLGYPHIISGDEPASCGKNIGLLDSTERTMIVDATNYLNKVIERAANAAGVKYVDISASLNGGRLCDDGQKNVTGIAFVGKNELQESFHPNHYGHTKIAQSVKQATNNNLLTYDVCEDTLDPNDVDCPKSGSVTEKPPITDFSGVLNDDQKKSRHEKVMQNLVEVNSTHTATVDKYTLRPNSTANFTFRSDPVDAGDYTVASDGSLSAAITIPNTVPAGYHTLIVTGETYSGEPIELTQTIIVTGTNPDDLDDNGVDDVQQPCGLFMVASGQDTDYDGIDDACDPEISDSPELYRVRQGSAARTYNDQLEHNNYLYIERNTRASSITGITGDDDPDGDGWAIVGVSQGALYSTSSVPDTAPAANFEVISEGANAKPYVYIRAGGYGCTSFTPTSLAKVQPGQSRTIKKVAYNTNKCRQEPPSYDVDGNGEPDDTQPLYTARNGLVANTEDPSRIYLYRNFHASEAQLGISDYTPTGTPAGNWLQPVQEWNLLASSKPNEYIPAFNTLALLQDGNNKPLPTILTKKLNGQCIAYQPESTEIIKQTTQNTRYLKKLTGLPGRMNCE